MYVYGSGFQNPQTPTNEVGLAAVLNKDGAIKPGVNGNFNASGFALTYGKNGAPIFVPETQQRTSGCGDGWQDGFGLPGANGAVRAIAVNGTDIYLAGDFTLIGDLAANRIVKWNGTTWSTLGTGLNGNVYAVAVSGSNVYAGGEFTEAGGATALRIARWNGSNWSALGAGINNGIVFAVAVISTNVYAGGSFTNGGGSGGDYAVRWNGTSWNAMNFGVDNTVRAFAVSGTNLYAGGDFEIGDFGYLNGIARWTGSSWSNLGDGLKNGTSLPGKAYAIAVSGSNVYVGGNFDKAGSVTTNNIARYDGANWNALGTGLSQFSIVSAITIDGTNIYAAGNLSSTAGASPVALKNIALFNGTTWSAVSNGLHDAATNSGSVYAAAFTGGSLYTGGSFSRSNTTALSNIARYSSSSWSAWHPGALANLKGVSGKINAIAIDGTNVYIGGQFNTVYNIIANNLARWNGTTWSSVGSGVSGGMNRVNALTYANAKLYVGGNFSQGGGSTTLNHVGIWNGTTWENAGRIQTTEVLALSTIGTTLYYSHNNEIWAYNGTNTSVGNVSFGGAVYAMRTVGTDLYIGGAFTQVPGSVAANRIAKYNGTIWSALGAGVDNTVRAIAADGATIYAGGDFTTAGGNAANYIAKWNGTTWSALGSGLNGSVNAIAIMGSNVFVAGGFNTAGGSTAIGIAGYNGTAWSGLGTGMSGGVGGGSMNALAVVGTNLYAGGGFSGAGCTVSSNFGQYIQTGTLPVHFVGIHAKPINNTIQIIWQVSGENNVQQYEVERSHNGINFSSIATVSAVGISTYQLTDMQPLKGMNYYRIKSIDKDRTNKLSAVVKVNITTTKLDYSINPNPTQGGNTTLTSTVRASGNYTLQLYNNLGSLVYSRIIALKEGTNSIPIDLSKLAAGIYHSTLSGGNEKMTNRIVVQ